MTPPPDALAESTEIAAVPAVTLPASELATGIPARTVGAPLRVVRPAEERLAQRSRRYSPGLTWLLDGGGWPWLRAGMDFTALLAAVVGTSAAQGNALRLLPLIPLAMAIFWLRGLYRNRISALLLREVLSATGALASATIAVALLSSYVERQPVREPVLLHVWIAAFAGVVSARAALLGIRYLARVLGVIGKRTLIVGAGKVGTRIASRLASRHGYGLNPVGFLDVEQAVAVALPDHSTLPLLGAPEDLEPVAREVRADHVVIAFSPERDHDLAPLIRRCHTLGLDVSLVPRLFESINHRLARDSVGPLPLHVMQPTNPRNWEFACKHALDKAVAAIALVLLAPLLGAVALGVKLTSPGPVFFRQRRVGRDGQLFEMLKFRSMSHDHIPAWDGPPPGFAPGGTEGEDRRTPLGRLLRRCSIDELPQLWNVLRGEMSLVGPRPERPEYVDRFRSAVERYDDRHRVKSGITGAAQVNGLRGRTGLRDRIEWDNYYIENWSLALDMKILAYTVLAVLRPVE